MSDETQESGAVQPIEMVQPAGAGETIVAAGDTIPSLAERHGHFWRRIWEHPDNAALKAARESENLLIAGDRVAIPPLTLKAEARATDLVHRFKRKGVPLKIAFVVQDQQGRLASDAPYELTVGSRTYRGRTDAEGALQVAVAPAARQGRLTVTVGDADDPETLAFTLALGALQPIETPGGINARLINLGYLTDPIEDTLSDRSEAALRAFQRDQDLPEHGVADRATVDRLADVHRS